MTCTSPTVSFLSARIGSPSGTLDPMFISIPASDPLLARTVPAVMVALSPDLGTPLGDQSFGWLKLPMPPNQMCCVGVADGEVAIVQSSIQRVCGIAGHFSIVARVSRQSNGWRKAGWTRRLRNDQTEVC